MDEAINAKEGRVAVKLVLDADAANMLPELAGSSRKQGEYVSKLIRRAAIQKDAPPTGDAAEQLRRELLSIASHLSTVTKQILDLAAEEQQQGAGRE